DVAKHHRLRQKNHLRKNLLVTAIELLCKRTSEEMTTSSQPRSKLSSSGADYPGSLNTST
ncbi:unnamed protein product, partial [Amoebophrya sp. A25]